MADAKRHAPPSWRAVLIVLAVGTGLGAWRLWVHSQSQTVQLDAQLARPRSEKPAGHRDAGAAAKGRSAERPRAGAQQPGPRRAPARRRAQRYPLYARAYPEFELRLFNARVFRRPVANPQVIGYLRRGTLIRAKPAVGGRGCPGGRWYPIVGNGFVCTSLGFDVARKPPPFNGRQRRPDLRSALPYRYAKVIRQGAPLFRRKPSSRELKQTQEAAAGRARWPSVVQRRMKGIYILALDREVRVGGRRLHRTIRGQYVLAKDVTRKRAPKMRGVNLRKSRLRLPLAFVHRSGAKRYIVQRNQLREAGTVPKQHRFRVHGEKRWHKRRYVVGTGRIAMRRQDVRVVKKINRPRGIPAHARWIHVGLAQQTLVAYVGPKPVYATLVASGKKGYTTRKGLFRIHKKYVTTTMDATDPIDGFYRIEGVPWTQYYWRSLALHGAYWHDDFGTPRSHGCTNIAPADARWLFYWSRPAVPAGWHARFSRRGTWVYITE